MKYSADHVALVGPVLFIAVIGGLCSLAVLRKPAYALLAVLPKLALFVLYFGLSLPLMGGMGDDEGYFATGLALQDAGQSSLGVFLKTFLGNDGSFSTNHYLYHIYNLLSVELFGPHYFAPVSLNIAVTFVSGLLLYKALRWQGFTAWFSAMFYLFFIHHWELLFWSSHYNMKDTLVVGFVACVIFFATRFQTGRLRLWELPIVGAILLMFSHLRFYTPVVLGFAFLASELLGVLIRRSRNKLRFFHLVGPAIACAALAGFLEYAAPGFIVTLVQKVQNPVFGVVRFIVTPVPWQVDDVHQALVLAAILHWITLPFVVCGIVNLFRCNSRFALFLTFYVVTIVLAHGSNPILQGPRHRLQIVIVFALWQLLGLVGSLVRRESIVEGAARIALPWQGDSPRPLPSRASVFGEV